MANGIASEFKCVTERCYGPRMKALVTGASGFIAGYLIEELLANGYDVVGLDNHSKYGAVEKSYSQNPRYRLVVGDAKDVTLLRTLIADCDQSNFKLMKWLPRYLRWYTAAFSGQRSRIVT